MFLLALAKSIKFHGDVGLHVVRSCRGDAASRSSYAANVPLLFAEPLETPLEHRLV